MPKAADITRQWYVVDAEGQVFGRVASQVANILRGKNKPIYTPMWIPAIMSLSSMRIRSS